LASSRLSGRDGLDDVVLHGRVDHGAIVDHLVQRLRISAPPASS
jgi:hypothetical protein